MSLSQTTTMTTTGTVHLMAPFQRKDTSTGWIESVDSPSKRLRLLKPAYREPNLCFTSAVLDEVNRGLRWGKHEASVPFFRRPSRQQGCFDSRLDLTAMPLETFYMIASYLPPRDLLKLSRTTKSVREKLMTRRARWVWKDAIESQSLPECPEDMSEPEYLSFLYDEECMGCNIPYPTVDLRHAFMRLRLCDACAEINVVPKNEMIEELEELCCDAPRDVKLLLNILPGYEANIFDAQSGLVSFDDGTADENSLVLQPEFDELFKAFYAAKNNGVTSFLRFYRGRRATRDRLAKRALLLAQTAQHILKSQLRVKELRVPPLDVKARNGRAQLPSITASSSAPSTPSSASSSASSSTAETSEEVDGQSDSEWDSDGSWW